MASLRRIPSGPDHLLEPGHPLVHPAPTDPDFVLVNFGRRWLLYDISGTTRVSARPVEGGATTLEHGALISTPRERLRFLRGGNRPLREEVSSFALRCSFCRDHMKEGESCYRCPNCQRPIHSDCLGESGECGRCRQEMKGGES